MEEYKDNNEILGDEIYNKELENKEHFDVFIISALEKYSQKIDEGTKGVILKVDLSKFTDEELNEIGIKINRDKGSVFKILKIENSVYAQYEAIMQKKAEEILNTEESRKENLAQVPNISKCDNIDISGNEKVINFLKRSGVGILEDNKINIMLMDYVPGVDLAFYIFRKIIEKIMQKDPENEIVRQETDGDYNSWLSMAKFGDFCRILEKYFGIQLSEDNIHLIRKNEKILLDYIEKNEVILNQEILDVFRKSVVKLHDNDFYHNDLHERNVRIVLDENDNLVEMYFIDFADASDHEDSNKPDDFSIFQIYYEHTITKQEKASKEQKKSFSQFDKDYERFKNNESLPVTKVQGINYILGGNKKENTKNILPFINQELISGGENYVAMAFMLAIENGTIDKEYILNIIDIGLSLPGPSSKWKLIKNILLTKNLL